MNFVYPFIRTNPEYRYNEVLSGYNYNFSILETLVNSGGTFDGIIITGGTITVPSGGTIGGVVISANTISPVDYIGFNTNPFSVPNTSGTLFYDFTSNSLAYKPITINNDIDVNIGQESLIRIYNDTSSTINKGQICSITGSTSGTPTVSLSIASGSTSNYLFHTDGLAAHNIASGEFGFITQYGIVSGFNLSSFSSGTDVYLSDTVPGGLCVYNDLQITSRTTEIGTVLSGGSSGSIFVNIHNEPKDTNSTINENNILSLNNSSTGLISFGGLSFATSASTFNVGAVRGWFIDNTTNLSNPTLLYKEFPIQSGITVNNLTGQNVTYVAITLSGTILQQISRYTPTQRRSVIPLGVVVHSNRLFVNAINNQPQTILSPAAQANDLIDALDVFNMSGNTFSANGANLNINKSAGIIFKDNVNFVNDPNNPHFLTLAALTAPSTIRYRFQNGNESSNTSTIDPNTYDLGSVPTTVPDTKYTIQRIFLFQSNLIRIQYGQAYYDSIDDARASIVRNTFVIEQNLEENGLLRGYLIVRKGTTNLSNTNEALFIEASRFGKDIETNTGTGLFRKQILNTSSTGLIRGGALSIASSSSFNISSGSGLIINNTTNPDAPTLTEVFWSAFTGVSATLSATTPGTAVFINSSSQVIQMDISLLPSGADIRDKIFLGGLGHPTGTITAAFNTPTSIINPLSQFNDFTSAIGPFSITGNRISKTVGALTLNKTSGKSFQSNGNFQIDNTNPSVFNTSSLTAPTLSYIKQNAFLGFLSSSIDTNNYDSGGTITVLPINDFAAHRIWHQPSNNILFFQYGQQRYSNIGDAKAGFGSENFIVPSPLEFGAYLVAVIVVRKGETNLDNPARAEIIPQGKFSGTGSGLGNVDSLQTAYNNSTQPEIITDATRGAVSIREGTGFDTGLTLDLQSNTGVLVTSFNGRGDIFLSTATTKYDAVNNQWLMSTGNSANFPAYSFLGDENTGFRHGGSDAISFVTGGLTALFINNSGFRFPTSRSFNDSTSGNPWLKFTNTNAVTNTSTNHFEIFNGATGVTPQIAATGPDTLINIGIIPKDGGGVGIGTVSPIEKLHVSGNTLISSGLTAQTINTINETVSGTLTATTISGDTLYIKNEKWTIELVVAQTVDFYAPYDLRVNSITNILNSPSIALFDDGVAYTLTNLIASGSKISVSANTASVVTLNVTR